MQQANLKHIAKRNKRISTILDNKWDRGTNAMFLKRLEDCGGELFCMYNEGKALMEQVS